MKKMIWSVSWKNIWRNKIRSLVVIIAVMLGLFGGTMAVGVMTGWIEQRVDASIHNEISHIQIHHPDFMNNEEIQFTIQDYDKITQVLDTMSGVVAYTGRTKTFVMAQSDWAPTGLVVKGIELEKEKQVSKINEHLIEGSYFEKDRRLPEIVIGKEAAKNLKLLNYQISQEKLDSLSTLDYPKVIMDSLKAIGERRYRKEHHFEQALQQVLTEKQMAEYGQRLIKHFSFYRIRAKITLTMLDTAENNVPVTCRIGGVFNTNNTAFDGMTAFVRNDKLSEETGFEPDQLHEIAIICTDNEKSIEVADQLKELFPEQSILHWKEISPELGYINDMMKIMDFIYVGIILLALAFGIINTMLMAVLERSKELGMLMAIGMNKRRVFSMIMIESVLLTFTGAFVGMIVSGIMLQILGNTGINFGMWAEGFEAMGYASVVYPVMSIENYVRITILVIITGVVASIWPARKALKMNPAEALRTE